MNQKYKLPPELSELEASVANRRRDKADADLRRDILANVHAELQTPLKKSNNWWSFAGAVAACLLLAMNIAIGSVDVSDYSSDAGVNTTDVNETTRLVQDLLPELSREQARRHSMVLSGARPNALP
ncbi:MAG: hypothetical protein QGG42_07695 [Phycisphaerae bacterium]|jgi:hypothetical protein|nr:hypothetical protein [Phycisphaerae bacterium]